MVCIRHGVDSGRRRGSVTKTFGSESPNWKEARLAKTEYLESDPVFSGELPGIRKVEDLVVS